MQIQIKNIEQYLFLVHVINSVSKATVVINSNSNALILCIFIFCRDCHRAPYTNNFIDALLMNCCDPQPRTIYTRLNLFVHGNKSLKNRRRSGSHSFAALTQRTRRQMTHQDWVTKTGTQSNGSFTFRDEPGFIARPLPKNPLPHVISHITVQLNHKIISYTLAQAKTMKIPF